jgi:hypothetical protein
MPESYLLCNILAVLLCHEDVLQSGVDLAMLAMRQA